MIVSVYIYLLKAVTEWVLTGFSQVEKFIENLQNILDDQLGLHQQVTQEYQDTDLGLGCCPRRASSTRLTCHPERPFHRRSAGRRSTSSLQLRVNDREELKCSSSNGH